MNLLVHAAVRCRPSPPHDVPPAAGHAGGARRRLPRAWRQCARGLLLVALAVLTPAAGALERDRTLEQLHHTAWSQRDGVPTGIFSMAQTADGFLWLGSNNGLFRFDGVQFEAYKCPYGQRLPSLSVSTLAVDAGQGLWIGSRFGGISVMTPDGRLRTYGPADGFPAGTVNAIVQNVDGVLWAGTTAGLASLRDGHWRIDPAFAGKRIAALAHDRQGTLWIASENELASLAPHTGILGRHSGTIFNDIDMVRLAPDQQLWINGVHGTFQLGAADHLAAARRYDLGLTHANMLFDRDGNFWLGDQGLLRIPRPAQLAAAPWRADTVQSFKPSQGLSGSEITALYEDREGDIWVATSGGLDRFRNNRLTRPGNWTMSNPMVWAGSGKQLWFGAHTTPPLRIVDGVRHAFPALGVNVTSMLRTADGATLAATSAGLWRVDGERVARIATPVPVSPAHVVQALLYDRDGNLWLSQARTGLFRLSGGRWRQDPVPGLFPGPAVSLHLDRRGGIWLGYPDSRVALVEQGRARRFDASDGLQLGNVMSFHSDGAHVWIGGDRGVAEFDGRRFHLLNGDGGANFQGVTGIVASADGALWLNGTEGVSRIAAAQLARARGVPGAAVEFERFDHQDGLPGLAGEIRPLPSLSLGADGRLWFATSNGVSWIDPLHIARNPLPPPVTIRGVRSQNRFYPAQTMARLPQLSTELEIAYTALSLAIPERVRFRYRLDGVDADWHDVGARRTAYYNNLGPGDYRFRVIASNNDGVWNSTGASLAFRIAPAFYQTWWFKLLGLLLAGVVLWLLHRLRLRVISLRQRARLDERERIARELHDTLLQSTQGLIVQFQAIADRLPAREPARNSMTAALDQAECVLAEGRDRVLELRAVEAEAPDLAAALRLACAMLAQQHPTPWNLALDGVERPLRPAVETELLRIAREALANAFRHAGARQIALRLSYGADALELDVRDDGSGMPAAVLQCGGRDGHWGLPGMRERAAALGATLQLDSGAAGTVVALRLPAALAYQPSRGRLQRWTGRLAMRRS